MSIRRFVAAGIALSLTAPVLGAGGAGASTPTDPAVTSARNWLISQQEADGGFELANTPGFETPDAVLALATSYQTGPTWDAPGALAYVQGVENTGHDPLDALDDLVDNEATPNGDAAAARAAKIIVLVAAPLGIDPTDFDPSNDSASPVDLVARVTSHQQQDGSYNLGALFNGVLYTTIALRTQGIPVPAGLTNQILAGQRPDGSWDYSGTPNAQFGGNDVDTTALALIALRSTGATTATPAVDDAVRWLASVQGANGAWQAFGNDDPNSTSMASMALSDLHVDVTTPAWRSTFGSPVSGTYGSPFAALREMQRTDGRITSPNDNFGVNTFATTQTMQGLSRQVFLTDERTALLAEWSGRVASPAAAPVTTNAVGVASDALGHNPSVKAARLAGATAAINGLQGRQAAAADLFVQAFNRNIDPSGRTYWSNKLLTISRPEMLARLTGSSEFYRRAGGTIPQFVDAVYQSVLGRAADPSGRAYWINRLNDGRSVERVARSLVASSEYRRTTVKATFDRLLDRAPTVGERDYWTNRIATTRVEVLIATLAASAEFYDVTIA
jgi:hypothetical protein